MSDTGARQLPQRPPRPQAGPAAGKAARKSKKPARGKKKRAVQQRPPWDPTVHDLDQYKLSPEEIERRRLNHISQNVGQVRTLLQERKAAARELRREEQAERLAAAAASPVRINPTPMKNLYSRVYREILYGDDQSLRSVMQGSNSAAAAVVEDLFLDDGGRYTAYPEFTRPPGYALEDGDDEEEEASDDDDDEEEEEDGGEGMTDDEEDEDEEEDEDGIGEDGPSHRAAPYSVQDELARFERHMQAERQRQGEPVWGGNARREGGDRDSLPGPGSAERAAGPERVNRSLFADFDSTGPSPGARSPQRGAAAAPSASQRFNLDATPASSPRRQPPVPRQQARSPRPPPPSGPPPGSPPYEAEAAPADSDPLAALASVVNELLGNVRAYEAKAGRPTPQPARLSHSFSSYTQALVRAVATLTAHLGESLDNERTLAAKVHEQSTDMARLQGQLRACEGDLQTALRRLEVLENQAQESVSWQARLVRLEQDVRAGSRTAYSPSRVAYLPSTAAPPAPDALAMLTHAQAMAAARSPPRWAAPRGAPPPSSMLGGAAMDGPSPSRLDETDRALRQLRMSVTEAVSATSSPAASQRRPPRPLDSGAGPMAASTSHGLPLESVMEGLRARSAERQRLEAAAAAVPAPGAARRQSLLEQALAETQAVTGLSPAQLLA